mmetsp:Transcript_17234/g.39831  ORF Transcript_17234/g.39831 Transcript_17234/m.39831 type:complete len:154 (-) Transcript_17234:373-834(-)
MAIPQHVKVISGTASAALFLTGVRFVLAPGSQSSFFPKAENDLAAFIWGTKNPDELVPGQRAHSKIQGMQIMTLAATKLAVLFTNVAEGTFLRRNVFLTMGAGQLLGSMVLVGGECQQSAKAAGFSFWQHSIVLGLEGAVLLYDALFRERKVK